MDTSCLFLECFLILRVLFAYQKIQRAVIIIHFLFMDIQIHVQKSTMYTMENQDTIKWNKDV